MNRSPAISACRTASAFAVRVCLPLLFALSLLPSRASARSYKFDGPVSEEVLRSYLSRSMTLMYLLTGEGNLDDNIRMMKDCGVKFAGRAAYNWGREAGGEGSLPEKLKLIKDNAAKVHAADPDIILQACVFEIVSKDVEKVPVPAWAFEALKLPVETRNFQFDKIGYPGGRGKNQWGRDSCIPDVSQAETKLWFYWLARSYMDAGCEAIHFGQVDIMNGSDPDNTHWSVVLEAIRAYAAKHARRHWIICDGHVPRGGLVKDGKLLLDFHSFPLRIAEIPDKPREAELRLKHTDAFYGRSKGGITPSGWKCEHLPFLVEFDNYGRSLTPGQSGAGGFWVWGWDEITWFSQQPEAARNEWLRYAWEWVRDHDKDGYVQMPGARCLSGAADGKRWYRVNNQSAATSDGFGQEKAIHEIWAADSK